MSAVAGVFVEDRRLGVGIGDAETPCLESRGYCLFGPRGLPRILPRSRGIWLMSAFWQKLQVKLQPTVANQMVMFLWPVTWFSIVLLKRN